MLNCFPVQKHGIVLGLDLATNGETGEEVGKAEQNSQTASAEIREGSSVLGKMLFFNLIDCMLTLLFIFATLHFHLIELKPSLTKLSL